MIPIFIGMLDESLPRKLKNVFGPEHNVLTVRDMAWLGEKNGALLKLMLAEDFEIFVTPDRNLSYQQNTSKFSLTIVVLIGIDNRFETLSKLIPALLIKLKENPLPGLLEIS